MKNKTLLKNLIISLCFMAFLAFSLFLICVLPESAKAYDASVDIVVEDKLEFGADYIIKEGKINYENDIREADSVLTSPSGKTFTSGNVKIDEYGVYQLVYSADYDGVIRSVSFDITVPMPVFTFSNKDDLCEYSNDELTPSLYGARVEMSENSIATYSEVIDMNKLSPDDPLVEFYILPSKPGYGNRDKKYSSEYPFTQGSDDFTKMEFILSDIYDETNYIKIDIVKADIFFAYCLTASRENQLSGYSPSRDIVFTNGRFGSSMRTSFSNVHYSADPTGQSYEKCFNRLFFDYENRRLLCETPGEPLSLVLDYDDSQQVTDLWEGFPSGKAKLTLQCCQLTGNAPATVLFTKINGKDISSNEINDVFNPEILIDYEGYKTNDLPFALVNKEYPIFSYITRDSNNLGVSSRIKVFKDYYGEKQEMALSEGNFIPDEAGMYFIEYKAVDRFKNETVSILKVEAKDTLDKINIGVDKNISLVVKQGQFVKIPEYAVSGGSGKLISNVYVIKEGSDEIIIPDNNGFIAEESGTYLVQFEVTDYLGEVFVYHYNVKVTENDEPVFNNEVILPEFMIAGMKYNLPETTAYEYSTGIAKEVKTEIYVIDGKGERKVNGNIVEISKNDNSENITVIYKATFNGKTVQKSYSIPCFYVKNGDNKIIPENYFVYTNAKAITNDNGVCINFSKNGKAQFINRLLVNDFELKFSVDGVAEFNKLNVFLTDIYDSSKVIKMSYIVDFLNGTTLFSVNDGIEYTLKNKIGQGQIFTLSMNDLNGIAYPDGYTYVYFTEFLNDCKYDGFNMRSAYLSIELEGVDKTASLSVNKINGQSLNSRLSVDKIGANIAMLEQRKTLFVPGEDVYVTPAIAEDVLDSFTKISVSVYKKGDNKKEYLTSDSGLELKNVDGSRGYTIKGLKSDRYYLEYIAIDGANIRKPLLLSFEVMDVEAPVITPDEEMMNNAKAGDTYIIPSAKVVDNKDGEINNYFIYVLTPDGVYIKVKNNEINLQKKGMYKIIYMAKDETLNTGIFEHELYVE